MLSSNLHIITNCVLLVVLYCQGQGKNYFPCSADHEQDWQHYPVDTYSAMCDDHTYIVPLSLFDLIAIPLSLLLHFIPLSLSLLCPPIWAVLHHLYMYMVAFLALRILYVIALVCFVFVPCSPPESLPGKDVLCRLLPRPLPSVCFLFFSFLFRPCSPPICFGETSSIL